jgi:HEAT repeat protein
MKVVLFIRKNFRSVTLRYSEGSLAFARERSFGVPQDDRRRIPIAFTFILALLSSVTHAQTTAPLDKKLDYGDEGLIFPPAVSINGHVPRTAQLLGDAYRAKQPLEWRRVQLVADLGRVTLPAAGPYLVDAMTDVAPAARAEAARSAAMIDPPMVMLLTAAEKLLGDADVTVRREAVLAAANLARRLDQPTSAIDRGLADAQAPVIAAALQSAWTPAHAKAIAQKVPSLPKSLHAEAADALGRLELPEHASALMPLLAGDVPTRAAAVRALGEMKVADTTISVQKMLGDPHPTVRREAIAALAKLGDLGGAGKPIAVGMLKDPDLTVREAAVRVLTPVPSAEAVAAVAAQLREDYGPLHAAARAALIQPGDDAVRKATIETAAGLLKDADVRRREDGSYVLGRLRSDAAFETHLALLTWTMSPKSDTDWPLVAQVAESLGLIGDARASEPLMKLVAAVPDTTKTLPPKRQIAIGEAAGNAMVALGRLGHRPALAEAVRLLKASPVDDGVPAHVRTGSAFAIGVLAESGTMPGDVNFLEIYASSDESLETKFEALKALGNLRIAAAAGKLKTIGETDLTSRLRWMGYWSYQRSANTTVPFTPATERREPPVAISDLPQ